MFIFFPGSEKLEASSFDSLGSAGVVFVVDVAVRPAGPLRLGRWEPVAEDVGAGLHDAEEERVEVLLRLPDPVVLLLRLVLVGQYQPYQVLKKKWEE